MSTVTAGGAADAFDAAFGAPESMGATNSDLPGVLSDMAKDPSVHKAMNEAWGTLTRGLGEAWRKHGGPEALTNSIVRMVRTAVKRRS